MHSTISAPLLSRVKSWQLVGLGISGWITIYSVAILTWGASSTLVGNTQGGCFALTMTLAGWESKRFKLPPIDPLQWTHNLSTEAINQALTQFQLAQECLVEKLHPSEVELGFGVRSINTGRAIVFETSRWQEPVIDLQHAQTTEENRKKVLAYRAVIVSAGQPDLAAKQFVKNHPLQLIVGQDLKNLLPPAQPTKAV